MGGAIRAGRVRWYHAETLTNNKLLVRLLSVTFV
jgi:hypothetical protein